MDQEVPSSDLPDHIASGSEVPSNDMPSQPGTEVPKEDIPGDVKYGSTEQQIKAGLEGAAQGLAGPLAPLAETKLLGVDPKDIAGRAEENPVTHGLSEAAGLIGGMAIPIGQANVIAHVIPEFAALGKIGSMAVKGALEAGALQGSDELSKAVIGQGDPEHPVSAALAHMGYAGLIGGLGGGLFGTVGTGVNKGLQELENAKLGQRAESFLAGVGAASKGESADNVIYDTASREWKPIPKSEANASWKAGHEWYSEAPQSMASKIAKKAPEIILGTTGSLPLYGASKALIKPIEKIIGKPLIGVGKMIMPVIGKALAKGETQGLGNLLDYATKLNKGAQAINSGVDSLFRGAAQQGLNASFERDRDKIKDYVENGGLPNQIQDQINEAPQQYAEGGKVLPHQPDHFANVFPTENMMLNTAKGRVYSYLNSVRPQQPMGQLPFDKHEPHALDHKTYDRALDIAARPLSVLEHVRKGTLTSEHVKHMSQMWPELYNHLSKKMMEKISNNQLDEEKKPSFKVRQAMSLFMAAPLEKSFSSQSIQAAQSAFAPKVPNTPAQGQGKLQRGTSKLGSKTNSMYKTQPEAAEDDRVSRD